MPSVPLHHSHPSLPFFPLPHSETLVFDKCLLTTGNGLVSEGVGVSRVPSKHWTFQESWIPICPRRVFCILHSVNSIPLFLSRERRTRNQAHCCWTHSFQAPLSFQSKASHQLMRKYSASIIPCTCAKETGCNISSSNLWPCGPCRPSVLANSNLNGEKTSFHHLPLAGSLLRHM